MRFFCHFWELLKQPRFFLSVLSNFLRYELLRKYVKEIEQRLKFHFSLVGLEGLRIVNIDSQCGQFVYLVPSHGFLLFVAELSENQFPFESLRQGLNVDWNSISFGEEKNFRQLGFCLYKGQI